MIYSPTSALEAVNEDLERLSDQDAAVAQRVIDLVYDNEEVRELLTIDRQRRVEPPAFECEPLVEWMAEGYNVIRMKMRDEDGRLAGCRILYALDHRKKQIVLLGVMPRNDDDNPDFRMNSAYGQRIRKTYDDLGIPHIPRHPRRLH